MRKNFLRQRRGMTLVELTVVMAITAIISVMIVSFSTLISAQVKKNDARVLFLQDASDFRVAVQQFFAEVDAPDSTFTVNVEGKEITFNGEKTFDFSAYEAIDGVALETNGALLKITLTSNGGEVQSFLLFSHCGASFTGVSL